MILSKTPFRISFAGGGTDLRSFYTREEGAVVSAAIDKYIYVMVKRQIGIVERRYRISWSKIEFKDDIDDIEHPIVREALRMLKIDSPLEISTFADVPAYTGLGSSSSFAVGLLQALYAHLGKMVSKDYLAAQGAEIEIDVLGRSMGSQDHFAAAHGGLNKFVFHADDRVSTIPIFYDKSIMRMFEENLMLFYTGIKRDAHEVLKVQDQIDEKKFQALSKMKQEVDPLVEVLSRGVGLEELGRSLHRGWEWKRSLSKGISNPLIDRCYEKAMAAGAVGGKILGAGGGGFMLFYVPVEKRTAVAESLKELYHLPIGLDTEGTRISYYTHTVA